MVQNEEQLARDLIAVDPESAGIGPDDIEEVVSDFMDQTPRQRQKILENAREKLAPVWQGELQAANEELQEADLIEAEASEDPSQWLTTEQLVEAREREPFIVENLESAGPEELVNKLINTVRKRDRVGAWVMLRHLPEALAEAPVDVREQYQNVLIGVRAFVVPERVVNARQRARQKRLEAEEQRVRAKEQLWKLNGRQGTFNPFS